MDNMLGQRSNLGIRMKYAPAPKYPFQALARNKLPLMQPFVFLNWNAQCLLVHIKQ